MTSQVQDPKVLYLYTSLTAGSSTIITATSTLERILKANKIPFIAIDIATDDRAKSIWKRRGNGRRLPGLVKDGDVIGNYEEIDEWNEYGELKQKLGLEAAPILAPNATTTTIASSTSTAPTAKAADTAKASTSTSAEKVESPAPNPMAAVLGNVAAEAAAAAKKKKDVADAAIKDKK